MEYLKLVTVNQAVESKGKEYREPDVGESLKSEKHPLAGAITIVSWMQLKKVKRCKITTSATLMINTGCRVTNFCLDHKLKSNLVKISQCVQFVQFVQVKTPVMLMDVPLMLEMHSNSPRNCVSSDFEAITFSSATHPQ